MADDRLTNTDYVWNQLHYDHDALIEASAGTGKTYALESIVLKLICDRHYDAKSILLVTFTEKAAGELKDRVRKALVKEGKLPVDFDEMTICTIHSFCQRLLSEYAFENGVPMRCEVGGDSKSLARQAVLESLKDAGFAAGIQAGLFDVMNKCQIKSIDELVAIAAKRVQDGTVKEIANERACAEEKLYAKVKVANKDIMSAYAELAKFPHGNVGEYILGRAGFKKDETKKWYEWLKDNFDLLSKPDDEGFVQVLSEYPIGTSNGDINPKIKTWKSASTKEGRREKNLFDIPDLKDCAAPIEKLFIALKELHTERKKIREDGNELIRESKMLINMADFVSCLANPADERFRRAKKQAALLTFDDMVARAAEVVTKEPQTEEERKAKASLFKSIRSRYRVALVDEFQDTDQKQWDIFRTLFSWKENKVEGGKAGFLLAVGDPKQAIYSFRGADVRVYCAARDELTEKDATEHDGTSQWRKTLDETYRSKKTLIDAFNIFFRDNDEGAANAETDAKKGVEARPGADWFKGGAAGEGIGYKDVSYPQKGNGKFDGISEEREPEPVLLIESMPERAAPSAYSGGCFGNNSKCLPVFMENAAKEMKYLNGLVPAYALKDAKPEDPPPRFRYGDMCVLVEGKTDAAIVRRVLARHGIPYGQYKQQGLYDSPEAEGVLALLDYLSNPSGRGNRAALLISPIFNVHPSELGRRKPADESAFDKLIERLQDHARVKEWNELFERVMSDDCTALVCPQADVCAFNRTRAATRQIFDALLERRGSLAETISDFAATLREWRKNDKAAGEDGALYKKESAADRVQIMTMHASKGLQFPIVFLAYGFANQVKKETPDDEKPAALQERRRLLYVALTRAEHRLYLPWSRRAWEWTATRKNSDGSDKTIEGAGLGSSGAALLASSSNGFLGRAIQVYTRIHFKDDREKAFAPERNPSAADGDAAKQLQGAGGQAPALELLGDVFVKIPGLKSRRVQWDSFTMMQKHVDAAPAEMPDAADKQDVAVDGEPQREVERDNSKGEADTLLARNNVSGNVFHDIMETLCNNDKTRGEVDFEAACDKGMDEDDSALMALIRQKMRKNVLSNREKDGDSTEKTLLRMVQNALKTEIQIGQMTIFLKDIPRKDRMAEVEFVAGENGLLALSKEREGALNGKIDLLVRMKDKVFILDWKTNSLTDYTDSEVIEEAMRDADYHLQYQLYSLAADAWLKSSGLTLAGAAYLFVRGGEFGSASGVFPKEYDATSIEEFRKGISAKGFFAAGKEVE